MDENRDIIRKQVNYSVLYRVLSVLFALLFGIVLVLVVVANPNLFYFYSWWWLLLVAACGSGLFYAAIYLFRLIPKLPKGAELAVAGVLFAVFLVVQIGAGWALRVLPDTTWSFGKVFYMAQDYVMDKQVPGLYLLQNPQHTGMYVLYCGLFNVLRSFGRTDFVGAAIQLNMVAIAVSVLLLYASVRYTFGGTKALFVLLFSVLLTPFTLYTPIFCAESMALPFAVGAVLLWQVARKNWRNGEISRATSFFCGFSIVVAIGSFLYWPLLVIWLAAVLDLLFYLRGKGKLRIFAGGLVLLALLFVGGNILVRDSALTPDYDVAADGVPALHYVRTGLSWGGTEENDLEYFSALPDKQARYNDDAKAIGAWFNEQGVGGVLKHIGGKLAYLFGDGTYEAPATLKTDPLARGTLYEYVVPDQAGFAPLAYVSFAVQVAMLFWALVSAIKSFARRNDYFTFLRNILLFAVLFMLVWPSSPRSMLPFMPVLALCAIEGGPSAAKQPANAKAGKGRRANQPLSPVLAAAMHEGQKHAQQAQAAVPPVQSVPEIALEGAFGPEPLPFEIAEGQQNHNGQPQAMVEPPPQVYHPTGQAVQAALEPVVQVPFMPQAQAVDAWPAQAENPAEYIPQQENAGVENVYDAQPAYVDEAAAVAAEYGQQNNAAIEEPWPQDERQRPPAGAPVFEAVSQNQPEPEEKAKSITDLFGAHPAQAPQPVPAQWEEFPPEWDAETADGGPEFQSFIPQHPQEAMYDEPVAVPVLPEDELGVTTGPVRHQVELTGTFYVHQLQDAAAGQQPVMAYAVPVQPVLYVQNQPEG